MECTEQSLLPFHVAAAAGVMVLRVPIPGGAGHGVVSLKTGLRPRAHPGEAGYRYIQNTAERCWSWQLEQRVISFRWCLLSQLVFCLSGGSTLFIFRWHETATSLFPLRAASP